MNEFGQWLCVIAVAYCVVLHAVLIRVLGRRVDGLSKRMNHQERYALLDPRAVRQSRLEASVDPKSFPEDA